MAVPFTRFACYHRRTMNTIHARMPSRPLTRLLALVLALGVVLAPSPVATPARAFFSDFTYSDERELGEIFDVVVNSRLPMVHDPEVVRFVQRIGARLESNLPHQPWPMKLAIVRSNAINAFAAPAGHIYIFSGLILNMRHESDLAAVMAHEFAHATERHLAERIEKAQSVSLLSLAGALAGILLGGEAGSTLASGSMAAGQAAMLANSRDDEREADHVGLQYLLRAGYNPRGMVRSFEVLQKEQFYAGGPIPTYVSTHPGLSERIGYLEDRIAQLPPDMTTSVEDDSRFTRIQIILRAWYTDAKTALAHFTDAERSANMPENLRLMAEGICHSRMGAVPRARTCFEQALAMDDRDPLVVREAGRFEYENGASDRAAMLLQKAIFLDPGDLMALFFHARIMAERGELGMAERSMRRVLDAVPEDSEVHQHLGRFLGQSGNFFGGYLHLSYAALYRNNFSDARAKAKQAAASAGTQDQKDRLASLTETIDKRQDIWREATGGTF